VQGVSAPPPGGRDGGAHDSADERARGAPFDLGGPTLVEVMEHLPDAVTLWEAVRDQHGHPVDLRLKYMNELARSREPHHERLEGRRASELWPVMLTNGSLRACLSTLTTGRPVSGSFGRLPGAEDSPASYDYRAVRLDRDLIVLVVHDNAEAVAASLELAESEARLRTVLSALEEGIIVQRADRTVLLANAAAEQMFEITAGLDPQAGREWVVVDEDGLPLAPEDSPAAQALTTGLAQIGRVIGVPLSGDEPRWLLVNAYPLFRAGERRPYAAVSSLTDVTERKALEAELKYLALHDALTGLPNRALLFDRMQQALRRRRRRHDDGTVVALLFVDLDGFKSINDRYGHEAGDRVLETVAKRFVKSVRDQDTVCRLGGDEFVVLLEEVAPQKLSEIAQRIDRSLSAPISFRARNARAIELTVGASIGTAVARSRDTSRDLLNRADHAMYEAKQAKATRVSQPR